MHADLTFVRARRRQVLAESWRLRRGRFPVEPLLRQIELRLGPRGDDNSVGQARRHGRLVTDVVLSEYIGLGPSAISAARLHGLSWLQADRYAVRLGLHPLLIWPEFHDGVKFDEVAA